MLIDMSKLVVERYHSKEFDAWCSYLKNEAGDQVSDVIYTYSFREAKKLKLEEFEIYSHLKD